MTISLHFVSEARASVVSDRIANSHLHVCEFLHNGHPAFFAADHLKDLARVIRKKPGTDRELNFTRNASAIIPSSIFMTLEIGHLRPGRYALSMAEILKLRHYRPRRRGACPGLSLSAPASSS